MYKLGKLPAVKDKRNIKLRTILKKKLLPALPDEYDIDVELGVFDDNMYGNDQYGNCVIAARAHQTLRFEAYEQEEIIPITEQEVIDQYMKETGGLDIGLVLLYSLRNWRKSGWIAGGKHYNIYAFAEVDHKNHDEVRHCIHLLGGVNYGFMVPQSALEQFEKGEPWTVIANDGGIKGGHGVYLPAYLTVSGYDDEGLYCMTWGKRQKMTWDFWDKYTDEAYGIIDNKNDWMGDESPVDVDKLQGYLDEITDSEIDEGSNCFISNFISKLFKRSKK